MTPKQQELFENIKARKSCFVRGTDVRVVRVLVELGLVSLEDNGSMQGDNGKADGERWWATYLPDGEAAHLSREFEAARAVYEASEKKIDEHFRPRIMALLESKDIEAARALSMRMPSDSVTRVFMWDAIRQAEAQGKTSHICPVCRAPFLAETGAFTPAHADPGGEEPCNGIGDPLVEGTP